MKYHPTKIAPNFVVPDVEATAKYYCDVLGFTSVTYDGEPPGFALVQWDQVAIMFKSYPGVKAAVRTGKSMKMSAGTRIYGLRTSNSPAQKSEHEADVSCAKSRKLITGVESLRSKTSTVSCFASAKIPPAGRKSMNETRTARYSILDFIWVRFWSASSRGRGKAALHENLLFDIREALERL